MTPSRFRFLPLYAGLALTAACGQHVVRAEPSGEPQPEAAAEPVAAARPAAALPAQPLTPDILYQFLLAEIAGQRGEIGLSKSLYLDLARETRDPRLARRAAEIAVFARDEAGALEAARLWAESDPASERAQQTLIALLLNGGRIDEAEPLLKRFLARDPAAGFMHLPALLGKTRDTRASLQLVERLAAEYPTLAEAQLAVAQAAVAAGRVEEALAALARADALKPGWESAAVYRAQLLARSSRTDALAFLREFVERYPKASEARLAYARMLVNANQVSEARDQFTRLTRDFPGNADVSLAAGLLSLQMGDAKAAEQFLQQALEYGHKDADTVRFYLGQAAEEQKRFEDAANHYRQVAGGEYLVQARARLAAMLARDGKLDEARALLRQTVAENPSQQIRLIQAEAELLREARDYAGAFEVLSAGVARFPDTPDLLYDRAMMAEKLGKLDVMEADLRRVIELRPDDAHAYNALGYTLADRTSRLDEALTLLEKALELAPDDAFILDSVGWAHYRKGNLARAQEFLERAYATRRDPEIAAHLGEVLWMRGKREEAGALWQSSLKDNPQNEVLLDTVRRLQH